MPTDETSKLERMDVLEARVSEAVAVIERLGVRCRALAETNETLVRRAHELENEIAELKGGVGAGLDDGKIINKIDRLIEKFGELHV
jgi:FtsZ-binding cell division protein ZapB